MLQQSMSFKQEQKFSLLMSKSVPLLELPLMELKKQIDVWAQENPAIKMPESNISQVEILHSHQQYKQSHKKIDALLESASDNKESLRKHLLFQLELQKIPHQKKLAAQILINNLDDDGFHICPPEELITDTLLRQSILPIIQKLDPLGCATQDYKESLWQQWDDLRSNPLFSSLDKDKIKRHIEILWEAPQDKTCQFFSISEELYHKLILSIKQLNPFPGRQIGAKTSTYIIPDAKIQYIDGQFQILIYHMPPLSIEEGYQNILHYPSLNEKTKKYLQSHLDQLYVLQNALVYRESSFLKLIQCIFHKQKSFFQKGFSHLQPISMSGVAQEINISLSQISRLVKEKYILSNWGIINLKYLFPKRFYNKAQESHISRQEILDKISHYIQESSAPLSDQKIVNLLAQENIHIARRTINKYRKQIKDVVK